MLGHGGRKPWIISSESLVQLISGMRAAVLVLWKMNKKLRSAVQRISKCRFLPLCYITVYFLQGDLAKNVQVGAIQGSPEHPVNPGVVGMEQSLGSHAVRNEPDA